MCMLACACACSFVRACVRACVCLCVRVCVLRLSAFVRAITCVLVQPHTYSAIFSAFEKVLLPGFTAIYQRLHYCYCTPAVTHEMSQQVKSYGRRVPHEP